MFHTFFNGSSQLLHNDTLSLSKNETVKPYKIEGAYRMKKIWTLGLVLIVAAALTAGVAFAQTPSPQGSGGYGQGMMGGRGAQSMMGQGGPVDGSFGPMHEDMVATFAEALNLTTAELQAHLDAGETMWQVAEAQGITLETFRTLMLEARADALQQAVEAGTITSEQADWMSQRMSRMEERGFGSGGLGSGACDGTGPHGSGQRGGGMRGFGIRGVRSASPEA
jgi:hypothetical protein